MNLCSPSPVLDERSRRSLRCCVDGGSDNSPLPARYQTTGERLPYDGSPYTSSNHQTDGQPDCSGSDCLQQSFPDGKPGRGLPSIDENKTEPIMALPYFVFLPILHIITMARKTAANSDAYCLDLRVRLSVGCKRRYYFFFLYLPVFSYLRL